MNKHKGDRPKFNVSETVLVAEYLKAKGFGKDAEGYVIWPRTPEGRRYDCNLVANELRPTIGEWLSANHIVRVVEALYGTLRKPRPKAQPKPLTPNTNAHVFISRVHNLENSQEAHARQLRYITQRLEWLAHS